MFLRSIALFATVLSLTSASIPKNYILKVTPICGSDSIADARIDIITDLQASAHAVCANDVIVDFVDLDGVHFELPVSYPNQGPHDCVFDRRTDSAVYVVKVLVSYGEPGQYIHEEQEEFTVSCVFDPATHPGSPISNVSKALIAPEDLQSVVGEPSSSTFTLELTDVVGTPISGRQVWRSRKVQLRAYTSGEDGEMGLRPVGCDAIGVSGARYAVLRAGCGDGIIFRKDEGFTTEGLMTKSPYFEAFGIEGDSSLSFECNFTTCAENCNGSSCVNIRKRRLVTDREDLEDKIAVILKSRPIYLKELFLDSASSMSHPIRINLSDDFITNEALYWTAVLGLGLIVIASLAVSLTACTGFRKVKVEWNKA